MTFSTLKHTLPLKSWLYDIDTNILRVCVHILLIVELKSKLYFAVSFFGDVLFIPPVSPNKNARQNTCKCFTVSLFMIHTFKIYWKVG